MLRRKLSRSSEIAGLLVEVEAVAERMARLGVGRGRHTEVVNLARRGGAELGALRDSIERNCTKVHSESAPAERVSLRGQDVVLNLKESEEAQFDRSYLYSVMAVSAELAELLDTQVAPRNANNEARSWLGSEKRCFSTKSKLARSSTRSSDQRDSTTSSTRWLARAAVSAMPAVLI